MIPPGNLNQQHKTLYHDFADAYTHLYQMSKELYPAARKFVEKTEPEINQYMGKIAGLLANQSGGNTGYQDISRYMSRFDDFTIVANKVFSEVNTVINSSEKLISRKLEIQKAEGEKANETSNGYELLIPELSDALAKLRKAQSDSDELEKHIYKLTGQWNRIKERFD
jgi:hypothetical protein